MKKQLLILTLTMSGIIFMTLPSMAWWNTGHEIVAQIASNNLTPMTKNKVTKLLKFRIAIPGSRKLSVETSTIIKTSTWPDTIKRYKNWPTYKEKETYSQFHFLDARIKPANGITPSTNLSKTSVSNELNITQYNVVNAIKGSIKTLDTKKESKYHKAVALRYLIHCVGDLHQPMHSSNPTIFGHGTYGGNLIYLNNPPSIPLFSGATESVFELHAYWIGTGSQLYQNKYLLRKEALVCLSMSIFSIAHKG